MFYFQVFSFIRLIECLLKLQILYVCMSGIEEISCLGEQIFQQQRKKAYLYLLQRARVYIHNNKLNRGL
jgi:hypothetical protein